MPTPTLTPTPLQVFEQAGQAQFQDWTVVKEIDPLDDSTTVIASLDAKDGTGMLGEPVQLLLRCSPQAIEIFIAWNDFIDTEGTDVTIRLDKQSPRTREWGISQTNTATFYPFWDQSITRPFIKELMDANQLAARVTPYSDSPLTAIFDLSGIKQAGPIIMDACER